MKDKGCGVVLRVGGWGLKKNAAKWNTQHAGKKYREYTQRRVCFVNEQVPCPTPI